MYPRVARTYSLYVQCRGISLLHVQVPQNKKVRHEIVSWPTGFHTLPESGGLLDQDLTTMLLFDAFLAGERQAAIKRMK